MAGISLGGLKSNNSTPAASRKGRGGGAKKRKSNTNVSARDKKSKTTRKRTSVKTQEAEANRIITDEAKTLTLPISVPITTALVLDTGGWTVKHGIFNMVPSSTFDSETLEVKCQPCQSPNARAKLKHQLTLLTADEIDSIQNKGQLDFIRSMERGFITDLGTQKAIWKRVLDMEGIATVSSSGNVKRKPPTSTKTVTVRMPPPPNVSTSASAVLLLNQPFTPRSILEREDEIWFRDFGVAKVGRRMIQCMSAHHYLSQLLPQSEQTPTQYSVCSIIKQNSVKDLLIDDKTRCCCVVDSGFSLTHIVPTKEGLAIENAIRRINVGGKLLTNLLKECVSYRQWNMMDEFILVNDAKEALCFVSKEFKKEMNEAILKREGLRSFDREFVLPNFVDTVHGFVRIPIGLHKENEKLKDESLIKDDDKIFIDSNTDDGKHYENRTECDGNDEDSDEESEDQIRKRILKQREEEKRRRDLEEQERQVLALSVERFTVPEVLFCPADIGLKQAGMASSIVQSIEACEPQYRAAMYHNIVLTGGNSKLPGICERLASDLRKLVPTNYSIRIYCPNNPDTFAWQGGRTLVTKQSFQEKYFISNSEWENVRIENNKGLIWNNLGKVAEHGLVGI